MPRRKKIKKEKLKDVVGDTVFKFLYYDRMEDDDIPVGAIEYAVMTGEVTFEELVSMFRSSLYEGIRKK